MTNSWRRSNARSVWFLNRWLGYPCLRAFAYPPAPRIAVRLQWTQNHPSFWFPTFLRYGISIMREKIRVLKNIRTYSTNPNAFFMLRTHVLLSVYTVRVVGSLNPLVMLDRGSNEEKTPEIRKQNACKAGKWLWANLVEEMATTTALVARARCSLRHMHASGEVPWQKERVTQKIFESKRHIKKHIKQKNGDTNYNKIYLL